MVEHHKQIQRKRNRERETERYKRKREKRAYLTEAFNDGELDLYKPEHKPYSIVTDRPQSRLGKHHPIWVAPEFGGDIFCKEEKTIQQPVKFNWFEKFLLWIKKW